MNFFVIVLEGGIVQNSLDLYFAFCFKKSSRIWQRCKQVPGFPRLTAPNAAFQKKYFASASVAIQTYLGLNLNSSETLSSTSVLPNTNVGGFKDWPLEQSHFNKIPSILFLLSTGCFRIAALGISLANTEWDNGCIQALPQQCQLLFCLFVWAFLSHGMGFISGSQAFQVIQADFLPVWGLGCRSGAVSQRATSLTTVMESIPVLLNPGYWRSFFRSPQITPNFSCRCWNSLNEREFNQSFPFKLLASFSFNLVLLWRFYRPECCVLLLSGSKGV